MLWSKLQTLISSPKKLQNYDALLANAMATRNVKWVDHTKGLIAVHGFVWQVLQTNKGHWIVGLENGTQATISNQGAVYLAAHLAQSGEVAWQ